MTSGPDVPADKQRANFASIGDKWPKDVTEIRFQTNDGPARVKSKDKAEAAADQLENAEKRAAEKLAISEKRAAESAEAEAKSKDAKAKADAAVRAEEVKAKEASKKVSITEPKTTGK